MMFSHINQRLMAKTGSLRATGVSPRLLSLWSDAQMDVLETRAGTLCVGETKVNQWLIITAAADRIGTYSSDNEGRGNNLGCLKRMVLRFGVEAVEVQLVADKSFSTPHPAVNINARASITSSNHNQRRCMKSERMAQEMLL
jgi:hypothetical protein